MKKKPQRPNSHDARHRGRLTQGFLHLLRLSGFALLLCLLLTLLYLIIIGIPAPLTRKITANLQTNGIPLQVDSITLSAHRGWILHNACIFSPSPDDLKPLLQADKLYVQIWPKDWTPLSRTEWKLILYCKEADVSLGLPWENKLTSANPFRTATGLEARLRIRPSRVTIDRAQINWGGYLLRADGQLGFSGQPPAEPAPDDAFRTRAIQAADLLSGLSFSTTPEILLHFDLPGGNANPARVDASLIAAGLQRQGQVYDRITAAIHLREKELQIDSLQISRKDSGQLKISGRYDLESQTAQADVENTLVFSDLLRLLPQDIAADMTVPGLQLNGAADFSASMGPAPLRQLLEQMDVQIKNLPLTFRGIVFDPLRVDLVRNGHVVEVTQLQTRADGHPLSGRAEVDLASRAWSFSAQGRVPTHPIGELLGGKAQKWIDRVEFTNRLADTTVNASSGGTNGTFRMNTTVSGNDAVCAGIPLDTLDLTMAYSNSTFTLNPIRATRGEKSFSGKIDIELDHRLAFFEADSSFAPDTIAQIIAPDHPTVLTHFTFAGPLTSSASGRIDYSGGTNHAVQGSIRAESVSAGKLTADSFQSRIEARGSQLIFSDTTASIFDGVAEGSGVFDLQFNDGVAPYRLDVDATELDLAAILNHFTPNGAGTTKGRLSATLDITADAKQGFWESANGKGVAEIADGTLRDLPILGGFSKLIRTTLPGFSLFSLTTFYSEYELRDGALRSENTQFGGALFSARARGKYSPQGGLNFIVRAEPLRQTRQDKKWYQLHLWTADLLKQGTSPLFNLLEFRLIGPLDKPNWRMLAIPKEAYELFRKRPPPSSGE